MTQSDWVEAVETGFRSAALGQAFAPEPMHLRADGGAFHAKGASLAGDRPFVALKLNGNFPDNPSLRGLPTIQGAVLLGDGSDGRLLAILDSIEITLRRTAAATALAARHLARPKSRRLLICGCGEQGAAQLEAVRAVLPIDHCLLWDKDRERAERLSASHPATEVCEDLAEGARRSDVIVTCTTSTHAFLDEAMVSPGSFIAAVGADSPSKSEIAPGLMARAKVVVDDLDQCLAMGDLRHAIEAGTISKSDVHAEIGALLTGVRQGRTSEEEVFLFDSTGSALQDVAAAAMIYERAMALGEAPCIELGD